MIFNALRFCVGSVTYDTLQIFIHSDFAQSIFVWCALIRKQRLRGHLVLLALSFELFISVCCTIEQEATSQGVYHTAQ